MSFVKNIIKALPLSSGVKLLNCDPKTTLFALNKPEGVKSHPNKPGIDKNALIQAPYDLEKECYLCCLPEGRAGGEEVNCKEVPVYLLNRLDSPTSGVILLCLNLELALEIGNLFKQHKIQKTYYAIVKNIPRILNDIWRDRLTSGKQGEKVRTQRGGDKVAETRYLGVGQNKFLGIALLKLTPISGFTHQLRVQGALHEHPILGDKTYGDFAFNKEIQRKTAFKRLFLHSAEINLSYNYLGKECHFKAVSPMPEDFESVLYWNVR